MGIFDAQPIYRVASRGEDYGAALDMPFSFAHNFGEQFQAGALQSFGLGTTLRDFTTPRGTEVPSPLINEIADSNPLLGGLIHGYEAVRHGFGAPTTGAPLSESEYKSSPYFRDNIPWDAGMTSDRAAALATQSDIAQTRAYFGAKDPVASFVANLAGGALDPINYVPVFGPAARIAASARVGVILGHALIGASEAAINTAVFGALTAPARARFGDDVSWQSSIDNIAMSAVAGLVFGGIGGAFARARSIRVAQSEQALRMGIETVSNKQGLRATLNDMVGSLVTTGRPELTPSSASVIERMAADIGDRRASVRALETETAGVTGTKAGEVAITPTGIRVAVRPEVVDISTLQPATGPLQARNRVNSAVSNAQMADIAANLDPARLMPAVDASQGSPLVGADNIVDSGNGRVGALQQVYSNPAFAAQAQAYRAAIEAHGFSTDGIQNPVLISRRLTDLSPAARAQFNGEVNAATTSRMSAVELAQFDRQAITPDVLESLNPGPVAAATNREFAARFLHNLPQNERAGLQDPKGRLNADGARRIENALVAAAYGDTDITAVRKFAEATDDNTRTIVGALSDVAGDWLRLRRAVQRGEVKPELDQTPELTEALRKISTWRDQAASEKRSVGTVIHEGMAQDDMLSGPVSLPTKLFVHSFYRDANFTQAASRETIAARLTDLANRSIDAGKPDMFGEAYAATKQGVLQSVYGDISLPRLEAERVAEDAGGLDQSGARPSAEGAVRPAQGAGGEHAFGSGPGGSNGAGVGDGAAAGTPDLSAGGVSSGTADGASASAVTDRAAVSAHLLKLAEAGDIEGIKASPELKTLVRDMESRPSTDQAAGYGTDEWGSKRVYSTPAGKIVGIDAAYNFLLDNARNLAADELGIAHYETAKEHKAVIVIGPPAAGKSTIANEIAARLRAAIPNPDEAKKIMPEYDNGMGSAATHEESSFLTNYVTEELKRGGENMVIPKVGGAAKSIESLSASLKHWGYTVDVVLMDVDPAEAFRRMIGRFVSSGRLIPPDYFDAVVKTPAKVFQELKGKGAADGFATVESPRGLPARISESTIKNFPAKAGDEIISAARSGDRRASGGGDGGARQEAPAPDQAAPTQEQLSLLPDRPVVDMQGPRVDPVTDGLDQAAARVGRPEDIKALADQFGVDPTTGDFAEQTDIEALRTAGLLTADDEAELKAADQTSEVASAWADTLRAAAACVMGVS